MEKDTLPPPYHLFPWQAFVFGLHLHRHTRESGTAAIDTGRPVAGSHDRNEFIVINVDDNAQVESAKELSDSLNVGCDSPIDASRVSVTSNLGSSSHNPEITLLTYGQEMESAKELSDSLNVGCGSPVDASGVSVPSNLGSSSHNPKITLFTYGQEDVGIPSDQHALIIPPVLSHRKRVDRMPFTD
ncbi:hypothetical protein NE237_027675 [Protea cynaroides]|uniref:Uncharacterized protein n=1 Tax=Protea cynaroides TaxID=273540 RepID=A0A9Q0GQL6_9MAGN|nr:hypothetical protein NE237_027675 [Protea cynaroides]